VQSSLAGRATRQALPRLPVLNFLERDLEVERKPISRKARAHVSPLSGLEHAARFAERGGEKLIGFLRIEPRKRHDGSRPSRLRRVTGR
jgi:hypothetical protein